MAKFFKDLPERGGCNVLGIDPDLRHTAWALVVAGKLAGFGCLHLDKTVSGQQAAVPTFLGLKNQLYAETDFWGDGQVGRLLYQPDIVLVEGQRVRQAAGAETKNPQSLVDLAAVAGAAMAAALSNEDTSAAMMVEPSDWKGTIPKQAHQARICKRMGWDYDKHGSDPSTGYVVPRLQTLKVFARDLNGGDWKHVMDAIGLALWGWEKSK